ncbi:hypothetical protein T12_9100 [Trichinella patagoniensis]|uniref:Uncharacterized protein n=1 Tax=Trichinella patagoniensis TaxID=990121 RepID=A0A0V1A5A9_9BILA|nr:hypothetical protein T12_9100 [Trichinella patagoniensis]
MPNIFIALQAMTELPCYLSLERNSRSALKLSTAIMACCKIHATEKKKTITLLSTIYGIEIEESKD